MSNPIISLNYFMSYPIIHTTEIDQCLSIAAVMGILVFDEDSEDIGAFRGERHLNSVKDFIFCP